MEGLRRRWSYRPNWMDIWILGVVVWPLIALWGWIGDALELRSFAEHWPQMVPITAIVSCLLATLLALQVHLPWSRRRRASVVLAGLAGLILLVTTAEFAFGWNSGLGSLLFGQRVAQSIAASIPGRMALQTLILAGLCLGALVSFFGEKPRWLVVRQGLALLALSVDLTAIIGYVFDRIQVFALSKQILIALPTSLSFFFLGCGILALEPRRGLVALFLERSTGGYFLRRFTFFGCLLPFLGVSLIRRLELLGWIDGGMAISLIVITATFVTVLLGIMTSFAVQKNEDQRVELEREKIKLHEVREKNQEIHHLTERLNTALTSARMATWEWMVGQGIVNSSAGYAQLFGYHSGEAPHGDFEGFLSSIHPEDRPAVRAMVELLMTKQRETYSVEYRAVWPDQSVHWLAGRGHVMKNDSGEVVGLRGAVVDIQKIKETEQALLNAKAEAEAANEMKSVFLSNVSHEIRTPMTAILGFTELLQSADLHENERQDFSERIQRSGRNLLKLIDDILDISKIEASRLKIEKMRFSPMDVVGEVVEMLRPQALAKGVSLGVKFSNTVPTQIESDPNRLRQILVNLVGNAVKFTERGEIQILVFREGEGERRLVFEVFDTGIGISKADQEKLFRPFMQADESITRRFGGSGLGLVLSQRLAEKLDGSLTLVRSEVGRGSLFSVRISCLLESGRDGAAATAGLAPQPAPSRIELRGRRVLLAEDMFDNQLLMRLYLQSVGATVVVAENGQEALEKGLSEPFDVILMDMQMPVLDGLAATRALRERGCRVPILALTAHAMKEEREQALQAGCDAHLAKPVTRQQLIDEIARLLAQGRAAQPDLEG